MAALSSRALQEQLSAIMGALTKAVVAEICELVDEGYALLQMEISRSRKENRDLKNKLHLIESIVVRGGSGAGGPVAPGEEPDTDHGGGGGPGGGAGGAGAGAGGAGGPGAGPGGAGGAGAGGGGVGEFQLPEVVLIKDEDSDTEGSVGEDGAKPSEGGAAASCRLLPVNQRARRRRTGSPEGDGRSVLDQPSLKVCRVAPGPQMRSTSGFVLDAPGGDAGLSGHCAVGDEPTGSVGSHGASDVQLVHQEYQQLSYFGDAALMESDPNRTELDFGLMWERQSRSQPGFVHSCPHGSPEGDELRTTAGSMSTDSQLSESGSSGFEYENVAPPGHSQTGGGGRGRRFLCSVCNRTYATSQNLEVHMRIHTGERPFSCEQCGKRFTQSAHLKSHMSIHSGERPYPCRACSRSFIVRYSLKLHMKKCHPNVPNE
ncbi:zinc finger protein 281-like isoform X2 [Takifugu rubripes]|uniref:zinc finger protein 281-like isoform X2 n=1 Tax=Takifugu rubripes TaxID=31033 RepID=UPI00114591A7|nr:zinc finger protein 281-like isoform X2 [Takifugu rubripes]